VNKLLRQMENPDEPSDASAADDQPADALVPDSPNEKKSPAASESLQ
jgi:hypothetical protein